MEPWLTQSEPGWEPLSLPQVIRKENFLNGPPEEDRLQLEYYWQPAEKTIWAKAYFGSRTQGPPGHAHGGSMAAVLDEAMGAVAWHSGHPVVAVELITRFKTFLPLGSCVLVKAQITQIDGRKVNAEGHIESRNGETRYAEGEALFIEIDPARFGVKLDHFFG